MDAHILSEEVNRIDKYDNKQLSMNTHTYALNEMLSIGLDQKSIRSDD